MSLLILIAGLIVLIVLMVFLKVNPFIALFTVSVLLGFCFGMDGTTILQSIQSGIGSTLSSTLLLLTFGALFGKILSTSGVANSISEGLIIKFGRKNVQWAMLLTAFIVGLPMFYTAGFVILLPIVFSVAAASGMPLLFIAIPMAAALSVTHGFLPPHPGPSSIAVFYKADLGLTMLYGIIIAIPTVIIAGPIWGRLVCKFPQFKNIKNYAFESSSVSSVRPSWGISLAIAMLPIVLISSAAIGKVVMKDVNLNVATKFLFFIGEPTIAIFLSLLTSLLLLKKYLPKVESEKIFLYTDSFNSIVGILLIIAAGGAFKQILVDSKVGDYIVSLFSTTTLSPLFIAWSLAAIIRLALGSATVAGLASAGMVLPFITTQTNVELMVLATGAGSLIFSHVNDAGFWIFKEYFKLNIVQTLLSWSLMETIISILGLIGVLVFDIFI